MTPRNESTLLRMQVDVNKAYDLLNMFKEAGKNRIDIQTILDIDESVAPYLSALPGSVFERKGISGPFERNDDFGFSAEESEG